MLSLPAQVRIFAATQPVDFRKAHDGLVAIVRDRWGDDPLSGSLFVFFNKRRDRIKLIQWDGNGLWLHYKRLERATFKSLLSRGGEKVKLDRAELSMLLEGIDLEEGKRRRHFADGISIDGRGSQRASRLSE